MDCAADSPLEHLPRGSSSGVSYRVFFGVHPALLRNASADSIVWSYAPCRFLRWRHMLKRVENTLSQIGHTWEDLESGQL